jgi:hypothetical protein
VRGMTFLNSLPDNAVRRLTKVIIRTVHLVGIAGLFGNAMTGSYDAVYVTLTIVSGVVLTLMEAWSGPIWFVQLRGIALHLKLLLLLPIHFYPDTAVPCLVAVIVISGFMSHAPSWIRYYSVLHREVVHSRDDLAG